MSNKSLTVTDENGVYFTITGTEGAIMSFLEWVNTYHRGDYNDSQKSILCKNSNDVKACHLRAIRSNLYISQFAKKNANA